MRNEKTRLVVGLGNPGRKYRHTRHNMGFMIADALAAEWRIKFGGGQKNIDYGCHPLTEMRVCLAKPMAYMNRSGPPAQRLADRLGISCKELIIVHDDIDLAFGRLKIKEKGGSGGHKGIKSIMEAFGGGVFTRLRVGIGRPVPGIDVTDYVLRPFDSPEKKILAEVIDRAKEAVHTILHEGTLEGMNRFNRKTDVTDSILHSR